LNCPFFPLDIIALRNVSTAVKSPINEINRIYSKTIQATKNNRPFVFVAKLKNSILVDLILLPHQILAIPIDLFIKMVLQTDLLTAGVINEFDQPRLR